MSIRRDFYQYVKSRAELTAILGSPRPRAYPLKMPQSLDTFPAVTFGVSSNDHDQHLAASQGTSVVSLRIDCWAESFEDADTLAETLRSVMQGFRGTWGSTAVTHVSIVGESDDYVPFVEGSDEGLFNIQLTYRVRYAEAIPTPNV